MEGGSAGASAAAAAFARYCAVRHRLPAAPAGGAARAVPDLGAVTGDYDAFLFDAYGVLNVGEAAVPGAAARLAALRAAGRRVMVVSNSAAYPKRVMMARYARFGFDLAPEEVTSSREALLAALAAEPARRWGAMLGEAHGREEFEALDLVFLGDDPAAYAAAEGFLLIGADGWSAARQALLEAALAERARPVLVGNPDLVAPREGGLSTEPGTHAHRLADAGLAAPAFYGKPFGAVFELALARLGPVAPERVLMVGDTLHTDILGGRAMGFATALVTEDGALKGLDVAAAIAEAGIAPDLVMPRI